MALEPLALFSNDCQPFDRGFVVFRFTKVLPELENSPPPLGTCGDGQPTDEKVSLPEGFVTGAPTMVVRPLALPHTANAVAVALNELPLFMSTRHAFFPTGIVELMLTALSSELENPPPPRILLVPGHVTCAVFWKPAVFVTDADWIEYPVRGCLAQTAYTVKVVSDPLALFTSPDQALPFGNELLMLALSELEEMNTPPPQTTVSAGHVAVPRVWVPFGASKEPELTTVYRLGMAAVLAGLATLGGRLPPIQGAGRPACGAFVSCR